MCSGKIKHIKKKILKFNDYIGLDHNMSFSFSPSVALVALELSKIPGSSTGWLLESKGLAHEMNKWPSVLSVN